MKKPFIYCLALLLWGVLGIQSITAQCNQNCVQTTNLNFSTGWDETTGALINAGQVDPHWRLMNIPLFTGMLPSSVATPTAYAINPYQANWNVIPGSMPVSMANQAGFGPNNADITQPWRFRRYFCVCEDTEVELIGEIRADDTGSLTLYDSNGSPMPFSVALAPAPNTDNFNVGVPFGQALFLPAGNYYFEFSLFNTNAIASGFAVQGTMLSANSLSLYDEQLGCCAVSVITGQKILDNDCNEQFDTTVDQVGVGFVFDLIDNSTGTIIATTQSDAFGEFEFNNLQPGSYTVRERQEWGWLGIPLSVQVTLGTLDVQSVTFFNCPYMPPTRSGCIYGDITADPTNIRNEKGLALAYDGSFFGGIYTHTFSSTNVPLGLVGDQQIVGKHWDNVSDVLQTPATLNDFVDADPGAHTIENLHVVSTNAPCLGGAFAAVGTTRNGSNTDIFYAEYSTNGTMLFYGDVTSTANSNRESAHELIRLSNNDLMWVGTHILPPFPVYSNLIISTLADCSVSDKTFSFQDANGQQVSVTGRSILELDTPLTGQPSAKYAVTGSFGNKTYLLLLDALFNPTFNFAYDIDGNPNTHEESIRIRRDGDNLFLLGNSRRSGSLTTPMVEKIFMLKMNFTNPIGITSILANKLYDIPGGGERIVDAEINFAGDIILTGVSALASDFAIASNAPLLQKTFLMGLDPFGNQLWLNQVQLQEGSEPADLKLESFLSEIDVVGTCWTNEEVFNNGISSNIRKFDEMVLHASIFGELDFNSGCQNPLDALVTEPTFISSGFTINLVTPPFIVVDGPLSYHEYFLEPEYCEVIEFSCDDLMITSQAITNTIPGTCCYSLDYSNNSSGPVYELCIRIGALSVSNILVDPMLTYTITAGNELKIRSATGTTLPLGQIQDAIEYCVTGTGNYFAVDYLWKDIDGNIICEDLEEIACSSIDCDFTWEANCCEVQFFGSPTGTSTYTYEWDINCDNPASPDLTGQSPNWTFPGTGSYQVCLRVRDTATGASCFIEKTVNVADNPPTLTCPPSITISTDPGLCIATHQLVDPTVIDDCTEMFFFSCFMSGATSGLAISPVTLNKGITTIDCSTEDEKGNLADCTYTITVVDNEPPVITCTAPSPVSIPACDGAVNVGFADPMVTDNCPMVTWTSSHNSNDFFPCGTTIVTFTATDMAGNQSTCTMPVVVNCECAEVGNEVIECTDVDDQFYFSVNVTDRTGSSTNGCTITVSSPQSGITISNPVTIGNGPGGYLISGLIDVAAPPMPNNITIIVTVDCICPDGTPHSCSFTINLATPCCKEISVDPQEVCKTGGTVQIPLLGCNTLYDVQEVRWYVSDTPCPAIGSWGAPFQVTNGCAPLNLSPIYHTGDVCVYAEVVMGSGAGPCRMLTSNIATITLCDPVSCNLSSDQAYCWTGSAITPTLLTVSLDTTECRDSIRWFDPQGNLIPAANDQFVYYPPALSFTLANTECSQSYTYRVEVTNECGTQSCTATIRLDNENAPVGTLTLLPPDTNPLCYGEDVILEYEPECAGTPERWDWFLRLDAVPTYTPLTTNGDRNPLYYSNRLYADTWVKVEKTNGVCSTDEIEIFLDVIDPTTINTFTAQYDDICSPTVVDLSVDFDPNPADPGCSYTVTWYRNGQVIQTTSGITNAPVNYTYNGFPLAGNYYCVVESTCCPGSVRSQVVTLDKPMEVFVAGPCFRCNCDTITLNGIVLNPLSGFNCTYQWYDNGVAIPGETGIDLIVDFTWDGPFTFEVTCTDGSTTCVMDATYNLLQCGDRDLCVVPLQCCESEMAFNDAVNDFTINTIEATTTIGNPSLLDCDNLSIDWGDGSSITISASDLPVSHDYAGWGIYNVQIEVTEVDDYGTECFNDQFSITETTGVQQPGGLKIFPNPTEGIIQVELPEGDHLPVLEVFNLQGKLMLRKDFLSAQSRYELDIRSLPAGAYILKSFSQEGKILIEQVIKQ